MPYLQFPQAIGDLVNGIDQYKFITMLPVTVPHRHRQAAGARCHRPETPRVSSRTCRPSSKPAIPTSPPRTGPASGQGRYPQGDRRHPEPGHQQGAGETGGSCGPCQGWCRARGRLSGGLWCVAQRAARALGQGGQGRRDQATAMNARHTDSGDSFRVTLLGTGNPYPSPERFGPSALVEAGGQRLLVDAGRGATIRLCATSRSRSVRSTGCC